MPVGIDEMLAELNLLMEEALPPPEDLHELHFRVQYLINELKAMGEPVPEDIARFERELAEEVERVRAERAERDAAAKGRGGSRKQSDRQVHHTAEGEQRAAEHEHNAPEHEHRAAEHDRRGAEHEHRGAEDAAKAPSGDKAK